MKLEISSNQRYFTLDGAPFFWLGDTAWLLFSKLTPEESRVYLENRAQKGFTVIQATLVHKHGYALATGAPALTDDDFARPFEPNSANGYWAHVLNTVRYARSLGLFMALLPAWGGFAKDGKLNPENAEAYAGFLADYFGEEDNVLWLVGGDVRGDAAPETFRIIGQTLKSRMPNALVGYHPFGRCSSSYWFHEDEWLDFNMFQSGHRDYEQKTLGSWDDNAVFYGEDNYRYVMDDYGKNPVKPTLDGEPSYEQIPHGLHDPAQPFWQAADVRRYAWWSVLTGAAGHTYGDNAIMQFWKGTEKGAYGVKSTWDRALHDPGSGQMRHLKRLCLAAGFETGRFRDDLTENKGIRHAWHPAFLTDSCLIVYEYEGNPVLVHADRLPFESVKGYWMDPVSGAIGTFGKVRKIPQTFCPPVREGETNDWVLILADAAKAKALEAAMK